MSILEDFVVEELEMEAVVDLVEGNPIGAVIAEEEIEFIEGNQCYSGIGWI
jgi:hypothetical protein